MKRKNRSFDIEFKKKIVEEFTTGLASAEVIAQREGISASHIYKWKTHLENRARGERIEMLEAQGHNPEDVRRILELEDELEAYKSKVAEQALAIDLLKKIHPSFQSEKRSSGYAALKHAVSKSKGRVK